jgi:hypothetical protein
MASRTQTSNGYTIDLQQRSDIGCVWTVRCYKKLLGFKRLVSSDWFLNREQADQFAAQLAGELEQGSDFLRKRRPGWVLRRPAH